MLNYSDNCSEHSAKLDSGAARGSVNVETSGGMEQRQGTCDGTETSGGMKQRQGTCDRTETSGSMKQRQARIHETSVSMEPRQLETHGNSDTCNEEIYDLGVVIRTATDDTQVSVECGVDHPRPASTGNVGASLPTDLSASDSCPLLKRNAEKDYDHGTDSIDNAGCSTDIVTGCETDITGPSSWV